MGSWWRSEDMTFVKLIMTEEAAQSCVRELGKLGCLQFVDLNPDLTPFQRRHVTSIKRCEELERKLRYCSTEIKRLGISLQSVSSVDDFIDRQGDLDKTTGSYLLDSLESNLGAHEETLRSLVEYNRKLSAQYTEKVEYHHLLVQASKILNSDISLGQSGSTKNFGGDRNENDAEYGIQMSPLIDAGGGTGEITASYHSSSDMSMLFSNISGMIAIKDKPRFERMLFRSTRGNCYVRFGELGGEVLDAEGEPIQKICFMIFYKSQAIGSKIGRICDAFGANRYDLNMLHNPHLLTRAKDDNYQDLLDSKAVLDKNTDMRFELCERLAGSAEEWLWIVRREKGVYHSLNMFKSRAAGHLVKAHGWLMTEAWDKATRALHQAHVRLNLPQSALMERVRGQWPEPPTHYKTNKYTYAFQEFVNTYGMPRYKEINPALFTAASFPFLFGVMFGDLGHGACLTLAAALLVVTEKRANKRIMDDIVYNVYQARYMLLGMGICATYCGLVYNDFFSLGLNFFESRWVWKSAGKDFSGAVPSGEKATRLPGLEYGDPESVYSFGMDPAWHVAGNELLFFNSLKMKMSVVLGITHMTLGIMLRGVNAWYQGGFYSVDFLAEFLPMIIFDVFLMGYMVILIFLKWSINWEERMAMGSCNYDKAGTFGACNLGTSQICYTSRHTPCDANTMLVDLCPLDYGGTGDGCQPPNLISTLINIVLKPGSVDEPMYYGQGFVQIIVLVVAFGTVPWLLCLKPYLILQEHKKAQRGSVISHVDNPVLDSNSSSSHGLLASSGQIDGDDSRSRAESVDSMYSDGGTFKLGGAAGGHGHSHGVEEFDFSEICIHQAIETVEFVLGMISNTASYLRLWALSLAHSELAAVFWEKFMLGALESGNPLAIVGGFYFFAAATTGVLLAMDVLECFLHALRLHWVEFQNKFFKADGYRFVPFDFQALLEETYL